MGQINQDRVSELKTTFFVEASAGTGKTRSLVERAIEIIKHAPGLKMHELVAITFTEKASCELKARLRKRLEEEIASSEETEAIKKKLKQALYEFEQAEVSTIHSFCARLLRLRPIEAGISPAFQVLDEGQAGIFFNRCWEEWREKELESDSGFFRKLRQAGITDENLRALAREIYENRDLFYACYSELISRDELDLNQAEKEFLHLYEQFKASRVSASKLSNRLENFYNNLNLFTLSEKERLFYQEKLSIYRNLSRWKKAETQRFQKAFYDLFIRFRAGLYRELLHQLKNFYDWLEEKKREEEVLDFQDLLLKTRQLVKDNLSARQYFKKRFKYILVDEFQDTDPLQVEVIFFLAEQEDSQADDWQKVKLAPGKLYLVGDPKQSIYHFRRADIRIYEKVADILNQMKQKNQPVAFKELPENNRSQPKILKWVNHTFNQIFQEQGEEYQELIPGEEVSKKLPPLSPDLPNPVVVLRLEPEEGQQQAKYSLPDIRYLEAEAVVNFILWAKERGLLVWEKLGDKIEPRPIDYKDFAILYPKHGNIEQIENKLREKDIPFQSVSSPGLMDKEEIAGIRFILNVLSNPLDSFSLVGALRSIYFGVSDLELFEYRKAGGRWNWLKQEEQEKNFPGIHQSLEFLRELYRIRDQYSLSEIIDRIVEKAQLIKLKPLDTRFGQALFNLEKFRKMAIRFEQEVSGGIYEFLSWLEEIAYEGQVEEEIVASEAENVVKLLTLHRAKGLEFPVVILANLSNQMPSLKEVILKNWEKNQLAINFFDKFFTSNYEELAEEEKIYLEKEKIRLFYVACTRAKQYLVIPDHRHLPLTVKVENQYISLLSPGLPPEPETEEYLYSVSSLEIIPKPSRVSKPLLERFLALEPEDTGLEKEKKIFAEKMEHSLKQASQSTEIISPSQLEGFTPIDSSIPITRQIALDKGALVHKVLEISAPYSLDFARKLAEHLLEANPELQPEKEEILKLLENFWGSEIREQILSFPSWQEVPFLVQIDNKLYRGKIDLVVQREPELRVIDFKTDRISESEIPSKNKIYQAQLEIYQKVLEKVFPAQPVKTTLYYLYLNREEEI